MQRPRAFLGSASLLWLFLLLPSPLAATSSGGRSDLEALTPAATLEGFRVEALYTGDESQVMGGRFVHLRSGFTFDLLQIESVPQAFMWVNSFPDSNRGEPHTQEHLLLGKGNKGRNSASLENLSLGSSSAFTMQWRTCYHFNTAGGPEVFFELLESRMDSLLHPDYTDEEIRREVRHFGVVEEPGNGGLRFEEKGTVYNEMVSTSERPWSRLYRALGASVYGPEHPLSFNSGGEPSAIREMKPEHIRDFHRAHYQLGNMGMVASFPKQMPPRSVLKRVNGLLERMQPVPPSSPGPFFTEANLPAFKPAAEGELQWIDYPHENAQQPGPLMLTWGAMAPMALQDQLLLQLFLQNLAGDPGTNLYKRFIDTRTRELDIGAQGLFSYVSEDPGTPVFLGFEEIGAAHLTRETLETVRRKVQEEIARIAALPDGSPELVAFQERLHNRIREQRRAMSRLVSSPPAFGFRNADATWMTHLYQLERSGQFRRALNLSPDLDQIEVLVSSGRNVWRDAIRRWRLDRVPTLAAARPSPALAELEAQQRKSRADAEVKRLMAEYRVTDPQAAIRQYRKDYDATTIELEQVAGQRAPMRFLDSPPLTFDDPLDYQVKALRDGISMVTSRFDTMSSATVGLALRLDGVPDDALVYLSLLPELLAEVGVLRKGRPVPYDLMQEQLRKEIRELRAYFSTNFRNGRAELVIRGAGSSADETVRALEWMTEVLYHPDWRPENLPRLRDLVDQSLSRLRSTTTEREEAWVNDVANGWWRQDSPLLLSTGVFLTRAHQAQRLRWLLKDPGEGADREAITSFLTQLELSGTQADRAGLQELLEALQGRPAPDLEAPLKRPLEAFQRLAPGPRSLALEAVRDLEQNLPGLPNDALAADWAYLCASLRQDLLVPPADALRRLDQLRQQLLKTGNARMFQVGSRRSHTKTAPAIASLLKGLEKAPASASAVSRPRQIEARLKARVPDAVPLFVGLVNPNTSSGVFLNSAPLVYFDQVDRESLLQYLASNLYSGGGAHSMFMQTWGAGLAYSNGLRVGLMQGRLNYYAERCPELPLTLKFVIDTLKKSPKDPALTEYAIAQAFGYFRTASSYESRAEEMAANLADGLTPEQVRRFRSAVLELRREPDLATALYERMPAVYGRVLPGYTTRPEDVPGANFVVIGPERMLERYQQYLHSAVRPDVRLYPLYPRDFWLTAATSGPSRTPVSSP